MAIKKIVMYLTIGVLVAVMVFVVLAFPTMLLWNGLMPEIFRLPQITFSQSLGLLLLSTLMFWRGGRG